MIFEKSFNLALNCSIIWYISLAHSLVLIFYPLEKTNHYTLRSSTPPTPVRELGKGCCDVTGRILKSKTTEHEVDFSCP